jgi:ElaB/YqjD/DUF883 family membrane-anchored ribosome-binding protein
MNSDEFSGSSNSASGSTRSGNQQTMSGGGSQARGDSRDMRAKAGEAVSKVGEVAQQAGSQAKQAAASLASEANQKAKGVLNQQVSAGADLAGHLAEAVKHAAGELDRNAPQLAGLMRGAADRVEDFSRDMRGQTVEELMRTASDFTRRQPALVFGLATLAGFALFRALKASPSRGSETRYGETGYGETGYRAGDRYGQQAGQFHGA